MIEVRAARVSDAPRMAEINGLGWRVGYKDQVPAAYLQRLPVERWLRDMTEGLRDPRGDSFTRIAELDGAPMGYTFVAAPGREEPDDSRLAELVALYVDPDGWRRGIGRRLLDVALETAELLPCDEIFLWTFQSNAPALSLYGDAGFEPDGETSRFVPTGTPTVRLVRSLA